MNWLNLAKHPWPYFRKALIKFGFNFYLNKNDRKILQGIIFPYLSDEVEFQRILFVGCEWYTRGYKKFFRRKEYWTLEMNPELRQFGAKLHLVSKLQNVEDHFPPSYLDLIICHGLIGYGINDQSSLDDALLACHSVLRPNGGLIISWDQVTVGDAVTTTNSDPLGCYQPWLFTPLGTSRYFTPHQNGHIFEFYRKL